MRTLIKKLMLICLIIILNYNNINHTLLLRGFTYNIYVLNVITFMSLKLLFIKLLG